MKYLIILLSFVSFQMQAKTKSDVVCISLVIGGGDHIVSTFIGSDINDIYSQIYRYSNSCGDEFGMPIYILNPKLVKYIEEYIQFQSFFYPVRYTNDYLSYYIGFKTDDMFGINHYLNSGIGGRSIAVNYFEKMLSWIDMYPSKEDSPEFKEFINFFKSDFVDFQEMPFTHLQSERMRDRWRYERELRSIGRHI